MQTMSDWAALLIHRAMWQDCCLSAGYQRHPFPPPLPPSAPRPPFIALYLCPPVWRWCHSWGVAMIKILLSPSQHGPALRRDSVPPVRARRVVAAHSSSCLPSTGGRRVGRALPAKAEILDICLREEEIKKSRLCPGTLWLFFFFFAFFPPLVLLLGRFWWRWRTLKHEGCSMWFAQASGGPLTHDRSPTQKENGPYKQGIKPSTRVVYYTVTFKQRILITGGCVYPGMLKPHKTTCNTKRAQCDSRLSLHQTWYGATIHFSRQAKGGECVATSRLHECFWSGRKNCTLTSLTSPSPSIHTQYYRRQPDLYLAFSCNVLNLVHTPQKRDRASWWRQRYKVGKQEGKKKGNARCEHPHLTSVWDNPNKACLFFQNNISIKVKTINLSITLQSFER